MYNVEYTSVIKSDVKKYKADVYKSQKSTIKASQPT